MSRNFQILLVFLFLLYPNLTWALRPIVHYHDLVAGQGDEGYLDGSFENALFNHPEGLALSPDGNRLYVADTGNHCIRIIHMDEANRVDTLAGSGKPGNQDGPCDKALLNRPTALAYLPDDQLWFVDSGNGLLRRVDLKTGTVITPTFHFVPSPAETTPVSTLSDICNIQYLPQEKTLYLSQPGQGCLRKLNPSTLEISTVLGGILWPNSPPPFVCITTKFASPIRNSKGLLFSTPRPTPTQRPRLKPFLEPSPVSAKTYFPFLPGATIYI